LTEFIQGISTIIKDYGLFGGVVVYAMIMGYKWLKGKGVVDKDPVQELSQNMKTVELRLITGNTAVLGILSNIVERQNAHLNRDQCEIIIDFANKIIIASVIKDLTDMYGGENITDRPREDVIRDIITTQINAVEDKLDKLPNIKGMNQAREVKIETLSEQIPIFIKIIENSETERQVAKESKNLLNTVITNEWKTI